MNENNIHNLDQMIQSLGLTPRDRSLYDQAVTHKSVLGKNSTTNSSEPDAHSPTVKSYERLEFLGDAVLSLAISEILFTRRDDFTEGELSRVRSRLINESTLAEIGVKLGIGDMMILSRGEDLAGGRLRDSLLADLVEALLGAIYIDLGYTVAFEVVEKIFAEYFAVPLESYQKQDYKSELQEIVQAKFQDQPSYTLDGYSGPDHAPSFQVSVSFGGKRLGRGLGTSKKRASQDAAQQALRTLKNEPELLLPRTFNSEAHHD